LKTLNANISMLQEKIIPSNLFKKLGGENSSWHPSFRRKGATGLYS